MDYSVFGLLESGQWAQQEAEDGQAYMDRVFRKVFSARQEEDGEHLTEHVSEMMRGRYVGCDFQERSLRAEFQVRQWELNPSENLHGGILTTSVDMVCGLLTRFYRKTAAVSTVHLCIDFLRPLRCGEIFVVLAKVNKTGKRITFLTAEVIQKDGQIAATASGTFV